MRTKLATIVINKSRFFHEYSFFQKISCHTMRTPMKNQNISAYSAASECISSISLPALSSWAVMDPSKNACSVLSPLLVDKGIPMIEITRMMSHIHFTEVSCRNTHHKSGIIARTVQIIGKWTIMTCIWATSNIFSGLSVPKVYSFIQESQTILRESSIILSKLILFLPHW